jgi:GT2 family glycosyltransferase
MTGSRAGAVVGARLTREALLLACPPGTAPHAAQPLGDASGGRELVLVRADPERAPAAMTEMELQPFLRRHVAPLSAAARNHVSDALARAVDGPVLARPARAVREAVRERLPHYKRSTGSPRGLVADSVLALDESSFYLEGWALDRESEIVRLVAVSPEGERVDLSSSFRFPLPHLGPHFGISDPDAEVRAGFLCFVELAGFSHQDRGWLVEMENAEGDCLEAPAPEVVRDPAAARERVLADPARERLPDEELMDRHVRPAMERLQRKTEKGLGLRSVTQFGAPPEAPDVSLVIPLYHRIDLVEEQLAQFVLDPYLAAQDIVYVLDSPQDEDELLDTASRLHPLYRVPFRVAVLRRNAGFANANNAGVGLAGAPLLLLMNSDVLPDRPGWLEQMAAFYESQDEVGALGPKLLYEDDSIQHAGIHFHRADGQTVWQDAHYFKGLHRDFPEANVPRPVPVVSGACMMVSRDLYDSMGGLQGAYVQGDYEDADLCLRLMEAGLHNWYFPQAELYHLEALSYSSALRIPANRYNAWLHTKVWGERIAALETPA